MIELFHYSDKTVELDRTMIYHQPFMGLRKPRGLWVSVSGKDDWESWCREEEYALHRLAVRHRVTLRCDADVLWLTTADAIMEFHWNWSVETDFERRMADESWASADFLRRQWPIDWRAVAQRWDGIIMAPYQWSLRIDGPSWYWGVDCASGCIWNLDTIKSFDVQNLNAGISLDSLR